MDKGIYVFFISLILLSGGISTAQDTITVPLHFRAGLDLAGPLMKAIDNDLISYGALCSYDIDESMSAVGGIRYSSFSTSNYYYDFNSKGLSVVAGIDYNLMKTLLAAGKYYGGVGVRYGLSFYSQETSRLIYANAWDTLTTSIPRSSHVGHYLEFSPGVRTELFPGMTIGWNINVRMKISAGAGKHSRPVYMPGYGDASKGLAIGAEYYISFSIPYKKIKVTIKPKVSSDDEEPEDEMGTGTGETTGNF